MAAEILTGVVVPVLQRGYHRMTCPFGKLRTYTNSKGQVREDKHNGIDLTGNPSVDGGYDTIIAYAGGKVVTAAFSDDAGYMVKIDHGSGVYTRYMHMKAGSLKVKAGQVVQKGQVLGYMGATGNVTGRHLHFDVTINGTKVDPLPFLKGQKTITTSAPSTGSGTGSNKLYTVTGAVNIRTGAGVTHSLAKCTWLPKGVVIPVSATNGLWLKTPLGWISKNFAVQDSGGKYRVTGDVNVRSGPGTSYALQPFSELPAGVKVPVTAINGNWAKIGIGWVSMKYLKA